MVRYSARNIKTSYKIVAYTLLIVLFCTTMAVFLASDTTPNYAAASSGSSAIVMEATSKRVLKGENIDVRLPMASTTKVMTALVVIENCKMDDKVKIPKAATNIEGSSIYLREGEILTVRELLYGLMLRSGNDSAVALAIHTAGSVEKFATLMNNKAAALGLKNSHFVNPHGLHDQKHYTSAYDLAVIASEGMNNAIFKQIVSTTNITISGNDEEQTRFLHNKNKILTMYSGGNGIKTGYTKVAGRCLVAGSVRDGMQVVSVVLNCGDMWQKSIDMMNYAHNNYRMQTFTDANAVIGDVDVTNSKTTKVAIYCAKKLSYPIKRDGSEVYKVTVDAKKSIQAPQPKDANVGKIEISINNHLLFSENIYTIESVKRLTIKDKIKDFFGIGKNK